MRNNEEFTREERILRRNEWCLQWMELFKSVTIMSEDEYGGNMGMMILWMFWSVQWDVMDEVLY